MVRPVLAVLLAVLVAGCTHAPLNEMPITDVAWRPVWLEGSEFPASPVNGEAAYLRLGDGRVQGFGGCNLIAGGYHQAGHQISLSRMISTRRACIAGMELEHAFLKALEKVSSWKRQGNLLHLYDKDERLLLKMEASQ
ncbi:MAG: META domain-containing protein [Betaproteobacteria bacterium]|nr:META domain-containing protein [Betaproteobacteria bacterium]